MRSSVGIWAVFAVVLSIGAAAASGDPASDQQNMIRMLMKRNWDQTTGRLPMLDAKNPSRTIDQVVSLSLDNGNVELRTAIASTTADRPGITGMARLKIDGWPEWASLSVIDSTDKARAPVIPQTFQLSLASFLPDRYEMIGVTRTNDQLILSMTWESPQGYASISFSQSKKIAEGADPHPCRLNVLTPRPGQPIAQNSYAGTNLAEILYEHPDETRQSLRPLLHALNGDSILAIEPSMAWQVFADAWPADPKVTDAVKKLLPPLAVGTFRQRNEARKPLENLGLPGAMAILHLNRTTLTAEQNAQLDRVVQPYHQLTDDQAAAMRTDAQFLVDCLYCSDGSIRRLAIEQLRKTTKLDLSYDPTAEPAELDATVAVIRGKLLQNKLLADE